MIGPAASSPGVESARNVCTRLHHAYRDLRLYPEDHPTVRGAMDRLVETLKAHLDMLGPLVFQVEEERLVYEGEEVYSHEMSRDNLAFLLFRDGIRVLTLHPGIEPREVEAMVDCLSHADQLADDDHDLSTALWEQDLVHVEYEVVDPFLEGEGSHGEAFDELRETVLRRLNELTSSSGPGLEAPGGGGGGPADGGAGGDGSTGSGDWWTDQLEKVDPESVALTPEELQASDSALAHPPALLDDFAIVLLEIIGDPSGTPAGEEKVVSSLVMVVQQYLDDRNLDGLDLVVNQLSALEEQGRRPAGFADEVFGRAATPERLGGLIASVSSASLEEAARTEEFLGRMCGSVYPDLLEILTTSSDRGVRKMVLDLLRLKQGVPVRHLWPLMDDPRWYVVRNAIQLATDLGDPELAGQLECLLRHPDARVRREVMRSLDSLGDVRSLPLLVRALQDGDSSVRILAVRSLGRHGTRGQFPAVQTQVESRDFDARPSEEVEAFLLTFARLGGERAVEALGKFWRRRMFGTRPLPVRVAAIQALGAITLPEASRALAEAARSGETQVQRAATRALGEAHARARGSR